MSVIPILVMPMPRVLTPEVPIHVPAMLDTLMMELFAQVIFMMVMWVSFMLCADINECLTGTPCDGNATCADTLGSYTCTCDAGFTGDGVICRSKSIIIYMIIITVITCDNLN